jgi:hypothetical protein
VERRSNCSVDGSIPPSYNATLKFVRNKNKLGEPFDEKLTRHIIEGFVVTDSGLYQKHNNDTIGLTQYVITLMNIVSKTYMFMLSFLSVEWNVLQASSMYNTPQLGVNVRLVLTRIFMFLDKEVFTQPKYSQTVGDLYIYQLFCTICRLRKINVYTLLMTQGQILTASVSGSQTLQDTVQMIMTPSIMTTPFFSYRRIFIHLPTCYSY